MSLSSFNFLAKAENINGIIQVNSPDFSSLAQMCGGQGNKFTIANNPSQKGHVSITVRDASGAVVLESKKKASDYQAFLLPDNLSIGSTFELEISGTFSNFVAVYMNTQSLILTGSGHYKVTIPVASLTAGDFLCQSTNNEYGCSAGC